MVIVSNQFYCLYDTGFISWGEGRLVQAVYGVTSPLNLSESLIEQ